MSKRRAAASSSIGYRRSDDDKPMWRETMLPIHGIYLLLIIAGTGETPERIGLEQQLDMRRCELKAQQAATTHQYAFISCITDGAVVSPSLPPPVETGP